MRKGRKKLTHEERTRVFGQVRKLYTIRPSLFILTLYLPKLFNSLRAAYFVTDGEGGGNQFLLNLLKICSGVKTAIM